MNKTIKQYMSELEFFRKDEQRSRHEREAENQYSKKIKYLWHSGGEAVDFFSLKEARDFFKERIK